MADAAPETPGKRGGGLRVAIDVGGTFVDAISFQPASGEVRTWKSPTTPARPSRGVLAAIHGLGHPFSSIETIVHGTTLGLNAILQRRGASVGLITTAGFEDVLEVARADVPPREMYNFAYVPPAPLVARRFRAGVRERIDAEGQVVTPLDEDAVVTAARRLAAAGRDALAVCFLHSYANAAHEQRAGELVRAALPGIACSLSVEVARQHREYERTTTTVLDAFIRPVLEAYLGEIESALRADGFRGSFHVMRSSGGAMTLELASRAPLSTVLSGPAGGIAGASWLAVGAGLERVLSFDVGGTSADTCVIEQGAPHHAYEASIDHLPLLLRVFDIRTIGAGGGSIASGDQGILTVGPASAGADPGPACYGAGGDGATVTDAAVVLGQIAGDEFLDGRMPLRADLAEAAVGRVAAELGVAPRDAAAGILRVAVARTVGSLREITTERGLDPREFSLLAFGGAGPLLGPLVAEEVGMPQTIVPVSPALFSAWGMLTSDLEYDLSRSVLVPLDSAKSLEVVRRVLGELERVTSAALAPATTKPQGDGEGAVVHLHDDVEVRYRGQEYGINVALEPDDTVDDLTGRFAALHERRHGHGIPEDMEVVACRVRGVLVLGKPQLALHRGGDASGAPPPSGAIVAERDAYDFATSSLRRTTVYRREALPVGCVLHGPAIVIEGTATTLVPGNQRLRVEPSLALAVSRVA